MTDKMPDPRPNQRKLKNFLINPAYQMKYIFWISITGFTLVLLNSATFYGFIRGMYRFVIETVPMSEGTKFVLNEEFRSISWQLGLVSIFFILLSSLIGLIFSHKTAGPLFQFKKVFNEIKAGNHQARVKLRPGDELQDVAQAFNEMMDDLQKK